MTLYDELYFDIKISGKRDDIDNFIDYLTSGELSDFIDFTDDFIYYDDDYLTATPTQEIEVTISNDDYGIEIDEFDVDDFLEAFCKAGKRIYIKGQIFDADNDEYSFVSDTGNSYYINALLVNDFNEDEDAPREDEDEDDEE